MRRVLVVLFLVCAVLLSSGEPTTHKVQATPAAHVIHGYGSYLVTYYYPTGYRTSSGYPAVWGEVATDLSVIPSGAYVRIVGKGAVFRTVFRARDTGGAVWGRHIDVLVYNQAQGAQVSGPNGYRMVYWYMR